MPVHDWSLVDAGLFHAFRLHWICNLFDALNNRSLPPDYYALLEQPADGPLDDGDELQVYARRADHIKIRDLNNRVVAVIDIVSPGNKASRNELRRFVQKTSDLIRQHIHLLMIDVLPRGPRDPQGIHKAIWDEFQDENLDLPQDKRLTLASYDAGPPHVAYVEPVGVGEVLPDMPLFLKPEFYVPTPLEATYQDAWRVFPTPLKKLLEG